MPHIAMLRGGRLHFKKWGRPYWALQKIGQSIVYSWKWLRETLLNTNTKNDVLKHLFKNILS